MWYILFFRRVNMNIGNSMMIQTFPQKTEYMICVACGRRFISSFRHPHQKYCKHPQCIRDRNVLRQRKSTQRHRKDRTHRLKTSRRKHKEYLRRKERKSQCPPPERAETWHDPVSRVIWIYIPGADKLCHRNYERRRFKPSAQPLL